MRLNRPPSVGTAGIRRWYPKSVPPGVVDTSSLHWANFLDTILRCQGSKGSIGCASSSSEDTS